MGKCSRCGHDMAMHRKLDGCLEVINPEARPRYGRWCPCEVKPTNATRAAGASE